MGYETFEKLCKEKGVTPYRVAKDTGVTTATLSSWKSGRYTPKADKIQRLADYFGVSVDYLMGNVQEEGHGDRYYINDEVAEIAQDIYSDPDKRNLYHALKGVSGESIRAVAEMVQKFKETNPDG